MRSAKARRAPVHGVPTDLRCAHCERPTVLEVFEFCGSSVMFCTGCECVWTVRSDAIAPRLAPPAEGV